MRVLLNAPLCRFFLWCPRVHLQIYFAEAGNDRQKMPFKKFYLFIYFIMFYFVSSGLAGGWLSPLAGGKTPAPRAPAVPLQRAIGASPEVCNAIAFPTAINGSCRSWAFLSHLYRLVLPVPAQNGTCNSRWCWSRLGSKPRLCDTQNLGIY